MTNETTRRAAARFALGVFAAALAAGVLLSPGLVQAATVSVAVENYDFAPATRTINVGDIVRWSFSGDSHSVTSRDGLFDSGITDAGGSFQFKFTKAGTYRYYCVVHPDLMSGTIVVKAASATPRPTVRSTPTPTPKPTARATIKPAPSPTPSPTPTSTPSPSSPPAPSVSVAPSALAGASLALVETPGPSSVAASPAPGPTEPASASDATPIVAGGVLLAAIVVFGGLLLARRRRAT